MAGDGEAAERDPATVALDGPMTLAEAHRVREALLSAFAPGRDVVLDLGAAGPWDLAGLQLVLSALATGRKAGQGVRLVRPPAALRAIADQAGVADALAGAIEDDPDGPGAPRPWPTTGS